MNSARRFKLRLAMCFVLVLCSCFFFSFFFIIMITSLMEERAGLCAFRVFVSLARDGL